jgi:VanZ family protein
MIINFLRTVAWALLISIVAMTVVPPSLRVVTGAPHDAEHAMAFLITGAAFGLGYQLRLSVMCAAAVVFSACLELVQLAIPGRHARVSDFVIDSLAVCIGIAISWTVRQLSGGFAFAGAMVRVPLQREGSGSDANQQRRSDMV